MTIAALSVRGGDGGGIANATAGENDDRLTGINDCQPYITVVRNVGKGQTRARDRSERREQDGMTSGGALATYLST